jgi:heme/copper-type cytochrome/quinol oxidase subunit 3
VIHGLLVTFGCVWLAVVLWRESSKQNGAPPISEPNADGS